MLSSRCFALLVLIALVGVTSTVKVDIKRNLVARNDQLRRRAVYNRLFKRADGNYVIVPLANSIMQGLYFANVTVGTPPQQLALQIDTGSSDVWLPSSSSTHCQSAKPERCPYGSFSASDSSTFSVVGPGQFNISYVDGTGAVGDYFQDNFSIGDATLSSLEMGLGIDTNIGIGILGIGYNNSEANTYLANGGNGTIYQNLPSALVSQGQANSPAYSLWLNDLESSTGSILFSGVDTTKFTGDLKSIMVYPSSRKYGINSFIVSFTSLSVTSSSGSDQLTPADFAVPAILDSGTTITLLPDKIAALIFEELGAVPEDQLGAVLVPCSLSQNSGTLNYVFGGPDGPNIQVAVSELILPLTDSKGMSPTLKDGQTACQLGIEPAGTLPVLLGDTFLRSAYAVYDLVNNRVALAQAKFNVSNSNIVSFPSFGAPIPVAKTVSNEIQVTPTASYPTDMGDMPMVSTTGTLQVEKSPSPTQLSARAGFAKTTSAHNSSGKKSVASNRPEPSAWPWALVSSLSVALLSVGSIFFLL